ncbi:response regulator [Sphingomonas melonis]|uniref:response regulator n=1 Tax=Sphingomonas melonis TaxID=152682 RepID=UPI0036C68F2A
MTEQPPRHAVIVVEDDDGVRRSLQLLLHWRGFDVRCYPDVTHLLASNKVAKADTLIADYMLPDGDGIGMIAVMKQRGWCGRAFLITGHPSPPLKYAALQSGYDAVLEKPLRQHELLGLLGR